MTIVDDVRRSILQVEAMARTPTRVKMSPDLYRSMVDEVDGLLAYQDVWSRGPDVPLKLGGVEVVPCESERLFEVEFVRPQA